MNLGIGFNSNTFQAIYIGESMIRGMRNIHYAHLSIKELCNMFLTHNTPKYFVMRFMLLSFVVSKL